MPIVRAISGDTSVTIRACRCLSTKAVTANAVNTPKIISVCETTPVPPNSASIRSSPGVMRLPIASAPENTTPMMVSSARCDRSSIAQTSKPAKSNMATAPKSGWMCSASATPMPGSATCDSASPASAMRRITAKHPTSPAASAIVADRASASMLMHVKRDGRSVDLVQKLRRQHGRGFTEVRGPGAQTQDVRGMLVHHGQVVRNEQHRQSAFGLQPLNQLVEPFLARFVDAGGRLVEQQHIGMAHQCERDQETL